MALFSPSEKQPTPIQKDTQPPKINPEVLGYLNISQEEIDSHHRDQQLETIKKEVIEEASGYFKDATAGSISLSEPRPVKLGEIALQPKAMKSISELPDAVNMELKTIEGVMDATNKANARVYFNAFFDTFGQQALDAKDWATALNCFDHSTEGGILKKPEVIKKLGEVYAGDKETLQKIALHVQERLNQVTAKPSSAQNSTPDLIQFPTDRVKPPTQNEPGQTATITPISSAASPEEVIKKAQEDLKPKPMTFNQLASSRNPDLVQPAGPPTTPILGETRLAQDSPVTPPPDATPSDPNKLRAAPQNPNPVPLAKVS